MTSFFTLSGDSLISLGSHGFFTAQCALFLAIVLLGTFFLGKLFRSLFGIPVIAGHILGGIILGPSLCDIQHISLFSEPLFLETSSTMLEVFPADVCLFFLALIGSVITVPYLLWLAGYETNIKDLLKVGIGALLSGVLGALISIVGVFVVLYGLYGSTYSLVSMIGFGIVFAATSVSIPVAVLVSSHKMHLKSSQATLGAAIVDDIIAVVVLSLFMMSLSTGIFFLPDAVMATGIVAQSGASSIGVSLMYMVLSTLVIASFGYFVIPPLVSLLKQWKMQHLFAPLATGCMFLYFSFSELVGGLAGITGAYFAGLFHQKSDTKRMAERIIAPFVNAILLPLFLGAIGLHLNLRVLSLHQWILVALLLIIVVFAKLAGCFIATRMSNIFNKDLSVRWTSLETYLFGSSMVARGEVSLVAATIFKGAHLISMHDYTVCVVVIVLTTIVSPLMLAAGFAVLDKYEQEKKGNVYSVNLGCFNAIGTQHLFSIIGTHFEHEKKASIHVRFSEEEKIIEVEGLSVRVIFSPHKGITLEGNKEEIDQLLHDIKLEVIHEIERISK